MIWVSTALGVHNPLYSVKDWVKDSQSLTHDLSINCTGAQSVIRWLLAQLVPSSRWNFAAIVLSWNACYSTPKEEHKPEVETKTFSELRRNVLKLHLNIVDLLCLFSQSVKIDQTTSSRNCCHNTEASPRKAMYRYSLEYGTRPKGES